MYERHFLDVYLRISHLFTIYRLHHFSHLSNLVNLYVPETGRTNDCLSRSTLQAHLNRPHCAL